MFVSCLNEDNLHQVHQADAPDVACSKSVQAAVSLLSTFANRGILTGGSVTHLRPCMPVPVDIPERNHGMLYCSIWRSAGQHAHSQHHRFAAEGRYLKLPSMPETSMALVIMRVSRNGTFSGNFSLFMLACIAQLTEGEISDPMACSTCMLALVRFSFPGQCSDADNAHSCIITCKGVP